MNKIRVIISKSRVKNSYMCLILILSPFVSSLSIPCLVLITLRRCGYDRSPSTKLNDE